MPGSKLRAIVGGGSIGGLCAGLALHGLGADVNVFEQNPGAMETRGAGIVVQEELLSLLRRHGAPPLPTTSCTQRRYLESGGGNGQTQSMPQSFTSWEAIYLTLRAAFPETRYRIGAAMEGFENRGGGVSVDIAGKGRMDADLLICADGAQSATRRRLLPDVVSRYAGYVAWRGTVDETAAPAALVRFFEDTFTFSEARSGGHMLVYFIPGANANALEGHRRLNWVWYVRTEEDRLTDILTDRTGHVHSNSLQAGNARDKSIEELRALACRELHPRMAELIEVSTEPFIQKIVDVVVPRTVFGRAVLLGDAAFVVRPHTAGATAKAASEATLLAGSLLEADYDIDEALRRFEAAQVRYGHELYRYGVRLGSQNVF
jgi:2-polyprenyl-6-methoxyphenol hydroxylase-like FAD-dependent oxidoreductase